MLGWGGIFVAFFLSLFYFPEKDPSCRRLLAFYCRSFFCPRGFIRGRFSRTVEDSEDLQSVRGLEPELEKPHK